MKKIIVLGAGKMGVPITAGLAKYCEVAIADISQKALDGVTASDITTKKADLSDSDAINALVQEYDLVVSALPESFGYEALKAVILAGKNVVDISFWMQNRKKISALEKIAKEKKVTALIDCGIAPGISNATAAHFDKILGGKTKNIEIFVGGIPFRETGKFFALWSIRGLIEEYSRKALCVKNGKKTKVPALSEIKEKYFPDIGWLEGGITDGLRSLPYSLPHVKNMNEYTLRRPGHFEQIFLLQKNGHFAKKNIEKTIIILSKEWRAHCGDKDVLVMRVVADNGLIKHVANFYADHDGINSAMAITTARTAILCAKMILEEKFSEKGVFPLEIIGKNNGLFDYLISGLKQMKVRKIEYRERMIA